jgi:hypothetical protein
MPRGVPTTCEFNRHFVGALLLGFCSLPVPMAFGAPVRPEGPRVQQSSV